MSKKAPDDQYSEQEAAKRRDDALRLALNTPPKPYKKATTGDDSKASLERQNKPKREK